MTTLVEELESAAHDLRVYAPDGTKQGEWMLAQAARLRARAARVREEEREHVNRSHDDRAMLMRIAGPDLGPTRRDGGT